MTPVSFRVIGRPYPKGSMRHVGKGRMVEQLAGSPGWRYAVTAAAHAAVSHGESLADGYPITGPVAIDVWLWFQRPKTARRDATPSTRSTGDIDKHARNLLDAITDAGVIKDDAQVIDLVVYARYCGPDQVQGAEITVMPLDVLADGTIIYPLAVTPMPTKTCLRQSHRLIVVKSRGEFIAACSCTYMSAPCQTPDEAMDHGVDEHWTELMPDPTGATA